MVGPPLLAAPPLSFKSMQVAELWASYCAKDGKEVQRKVGKKIFFFPCLARPGEEEDGAVQNGTVLSFLFFFFVFIIFYGDPKMGYNSFIKSGH